METLIYEVTDLLKKSEKRLSKLSTGGPLEDSTIRKNMLVKYFDKPTDVTSVKF